MSSGASRALDVRNRAVEPLELWTSEINAFLNRILNGNELWGPPDLWRFEIDAFLDETLNRNELWGPQTSGGSKLVLFLMDFVIEMCH